MIKRPERNYDKISSPVLKEYTVRKTKNYSQKFCPLFHLQNHLQDDFFQIFSSYSRNCILVLYVFFYFPSLRITFVFYISDRSTRTNNAPWKCQQQKKLETSRLAGGVVFVSIYVKYFMEVEGGFPRPYPSNFFRCKLLKPIKRPTPAELTNYA